MEEWKYRPAADLDAPLVERLRRFPREPEMLPFALRGLAALLVRGGLRLFHRLEIEGRERIPADTSCVLVANHQSHLDALCLAAALPLSRLHRVFPAAASDYFFSSAPRTLFSAVVINALPFDRRLHPHQSLQACGELLANPGNVLIVFPEGTRSTGGELGPFKSGVGALLAGSPVPVLPCGIVGTGRAWPKGRVLPRPGRVVVRVGTPRTYADRAPGRESAHAVAADLRQAVLDLLA